MASHREQLLAEFAILQQHRGNPAYEQMVKVLKLIADCYKEDMSTLTPESLRYKQGGLAQVTVLRDQMIEQRPGDVPKI